MRATDRCGPWPGGKVVPTGTTFDQTRTGRRRALAVRRLGGDRPQPDCDFYPFRGAPNRPAPADRCQFTGRRCKKALVGGTPLRCRGPAEQNVLIEGSSDASVCMDVLMCKGKANGPRGEHGPSSNQK